MNILDFIIDENEEKVSIVNEFKLNDTYREEISIFINKIIEVMNEHEELIYEVDNTEIKGKIKKNEEKEFNKLFEEIEDFVIQESIKLNIDVYKNEKSNVVDIFNLKIFFEKLNNLCIEEQLEKFQEWYLNGKFLFLSRIENIHLITESFCFTSKNDNLYKIKSNINRRKEIIEYRNYYCNYNSKFKLNLVPEDFNIVESNENVKNLKKLVSRLCNFLSLIYICDYSEFCVDKFVYKIFGYKTINNVIENTRTCNLDTDNLIKLIKWIYSNESSISDKLGITRNILSLHLSNSGIESIDDSILSSCRSNYSIFLKENVEKYIEVKTQQIVLLNSVIEEISDINDLYIKGFNQSLIAIFSFFLTTLLFNVISTGKLNNIFTLEITIISIGIIIISFAYMCISYKMAKNRFERIEKKYFKNKEMYLDIMDKEDIEHIFGNDVFFKEETDSYSSDLNSWKALWIIINVILLIIILICNSLIKNV